MGMLTDSHAHLDDEQYAGEVDGVIDRARAAGMTFILNPGCDEPTSRRAVALSETYDLVYAAVGFHPSDCAAYDPAIHRPMMKAWCDRPKTLAIGEIGLDYHYDDGAPRDLQKKVFEEQMGLAGEWGLPIIIHDREAHGDSLAIVREFPAVRGVFHCFSGSVEMAEELLKLGWMLSFNGAITFKNARKAPEVIAAVPLERMMVETDAPYLTPVPFRGKRNDSGYVHLVAEKIAQLKGLPAEQVERQTWENGVRFFGIPQE